MRQSAIQGLRGDPAQQSPLEAGARGLAAGAAEMVVPRSGAELVGDIAAFAVGGGLQRFRMSDRSVTLKGLAEKDAESDLAVWSLSFRRAAPGSSR